MSTGMRATTSVATSATVSTAASAPGEACCANKKQQKDYKFFHG
jgi:hypothetical protein